MQLSIFIVKINTVPTQCFGILSLVCVCGVGENRGGETLPRMQKSALYVWREERKKCSLGVYREASFQDSGLTVVLVDRKPCTQSPHPHLH